MLFEKVLEYCEEKKISVSEFERRCELGHGTIGKYKGNTLPTVKTLQRIAEKTETEVSAWLK